MNYDVIIIGGGIGGLMTAYNLRKQNKGISIAIFEKGKMIEDRKCPASQKNGCVKCKSCSITSGYAGAGSFSDGKYNLGTAYGGTLGEELGETLAMKYIQDVESVLDYFTPDENKKYIHTYDTDEELRIKCLQNNLRLLDMKVKHLGTDNNFDIMSTLISWLRLNGVELFSGFEVEKIQMSVKTFEDMKPRYQIFEKNKGRYYYAEHIVIATGRNGSEFVENICENFNIPISSNTVDLGVRVEMKDVIWKHFSDKIYEPKILYKTKTFEDRTRMFCFNQGGKVSAENNDGIITANGHSFADKSRKTENCNFAILSSINFTEPFNKPTEYVKSYSKMANIIGADNVIVQRFGDLIRGRRTNEHRLNQNTVEPTLKATAGDLSLVLPHRILTNIIETIYALDKVAPGTANDDTLLYGCEAKYYSIKPHHNENFEIYTNMYLIGDGSGICRGLSQSGAMGLYVADKIIEKIK